MLILSERVGLYWWRRDTTIPVRVKILACGDRAKAQTAATLQDINIPWRALQTHSAVDTTTINIGVFGFHYLKGTVFVCCA